MVNYTLKTIRDIKNNSKYEICISCSLFKMNNPYADFGKYIFNFLRWFSKIPKGAYVRLYVDASVLDDKDFDKIFFNKSPKLEVVLYEFPDFISQEAKELELYRHDGTFGTITRFLAFYNKPALPVSVKYIWVSDMDSKPYNFSYQDIINMKKYNAEVLHLSFACYPNPWIDMDVKYPIIASKVIFKRNVKLPFKNFDKFLQDILDGKYDDIKEQIFVAYRLKKYNRIKDESAIKYFPYGFDELFMNRTVIHDLMKYKKLAYYDLRLSSFNKYIKDELFSEVNNISEEFRKRKISSSVETNDDKALRNGLIKVNKEIYEKYKDMPISLPERLNVCLSDFGKYESIINNPVISDTAMGAIVIY